MRVKLYTVMWTGQYGDHDFDRASVTEASVGNENVDTSVVPLYLDLDAAQAHADRGNRTFRDTEHYVAEVLVLIPGNRVP